jgi:hypothetical protein
LRIGIMVQKGWVGRTGKRLQPDDNDVFVCVDTGDRFTEADGVLVRLG